MVKQQSFDQALRQVDQVIVSADVREFVHQDQFHLLRRQSSQES